MTRLLSILARLLATIALSPMPGQAQTTRVQFDLFTQDDDLREDSAASYLLELDDGRVVVGGQVVGRLADRTHIIPYPTFDLPPGITRDKIRFARVNFGPAPGPYPKDIAKAFWSNDQWNVSITVGTQVVPPDPPSRWSPLTSVRKWVFKHPSSWQSAPLVRQNLPASITGANQFVVSICTGDDDLRTDPNVQPNSEINVYAHLVPTAGGGKVLLDTGRGRHRDFVSDAPGADSVYSGSFKDWQCAFANADAGGAIHLLRDIDHFSIEMVAGRRRPGLTSGSDPFRGDDQWVLRDFVVSVLPPGVSAPPFAGFPYITAYHNIFSQLNMRFKLKAGRPWTSDTWVH
jgi:hypothetical protein